MSTEPQTPQDDAVEDVPFGSSALPRYAMVGLVAAIVPFVLKVQSWSSESTGTGMQVSYSDPVAMICGVLALVLGVVMLVGAVRKRPAAPTLMTWGLGVAMVGAGVWHGLRGFGMLMPDGIG